MRSIKDSLLSDSFYRFKFAVGLSYTTDDSRRSSATVESPTLAVARELACFIWGMMTDNVSVKLA